MSTQTQIETVSDKKMSLNILGHKFGDIAWGFMGTPLSNRVYSTRDSFHAAFRNDRVPTPEFLKLIHREWSSIVRIMENSQIYSQSVLKSSYEIMNGLATHI